MELSLKDYNIDYDQTQLKLKIKNSLIWLPSNIRKLIYGNQILFIFIFLVFINFIKDPYFFRGVVNSLVNLQLSKTTSSSGEISKMFQKPLVYFLKKK